MLTKETIDRLAQATSIEQAQEALNGTEALAALPKDYELHNLEKYLEGRRRQRGTMTTAVVGDFASFARTQADDGAAVFVDGKAMQATAILNLRTIDGTPGHCDYQAKLIMQMTAPYRALKAHQGDPLKQRTLAEFLEDQLPHVNCYGADGTFIDTKHAIAAVRRITIESLAKVGSEVQSLSAERTSLESVKATSPDPIPAFIDFGCEPFFGLKPRIFRMRLGINTGDREPTLKLHLVNGEKHEDDMAQELVGLVQAAIGDAMPVMVGSFSAGA